jgi:glycosyltransferase involved in cell wall biosynthesis
MSPRSDADVTALITFHREGLLAHKSLLSLFRCREAAAAVGISLEILATLDRADEETTRILSAHAYSGAVDRLVSLDCGDLGMSRNAGVLAASGTHVLICDGDDYLSADFIVRCRRFGDLHAQNTILHPQLVVTFEAETALWWQTGSDEATFESACMLVTNPWNACSFASRDVYLQTPYARARPGESGFGFEDWHWNCETLSKGCAHLVVPDTVHYVRKKSSGSLNNAHSSQDALIPPTSLFDFQ